MANKFEDMTFDNNDYQVVKKFRKIITQIWVGRKKSKLVFNKKSNSEKLDELVKKFNAKSRSVIIDMLIEKVNYKSIIKVILLSC